MKNFTGKRLECLLLFICFALFIVVLPEWISILITGIGLIFCLVSMIVNNFFGRF